MPFSGNFTRVTLGDDPEAAGRQAVLVEGQTPVSNPPTAIHLVMTRKSGKALNADVPAPGLAVWVATFPDGDDPFTIDEEVFLVGIAVRPAPHDPFVWEGSFALAPRSFP
jgi:hypothetical protein